jgi:hypothetical protein
VSIESLVSLYNFELFVDSLAASISNVGQSNVSNSGPAIYTVMPGHFVLQPCYPSSSAGPSTSLHSVNTTTARFSGDDLHEAVTSYRVRPETPPPPYPGPNKLSSVDQEEQVFGKP